MSNLPPGVTDRDCEGEPCPECGQHDCDCLEPEWFDPASRRERLEEMKADEE